MGSLWIGGPVVHRSIRYVYAFTAAVITLLAFVPLIEDTPGYGYDSLVMMAGDGEGLGLMGALVFALLVGLLVIALCYVGIFLLPATIALVAGLVTLMLLFRPDLDDPPLTAAGVFGTAVLGVLTIVASVHTVRQFRVDLGS